VGFFALLTTGCYHCVRGFDNLHQGTKQMPPDPVWDALQKIRKHGTAREQDH
jgi:hypothetical protein